MNERKTLVLFALGTGMIVSANSVVTKKQAPKPRIFLGLTVAYILLGFLVEFAPSLAVMFAALIFVSVALSQGQKVFAGVSKALRK